MVKEMKVVWCHPIFELNAIELAKHLKCGVSSELVWTEPCVIYGAHEIAVQVGLTSHPDVVHIILNTEHHESIHFKSKYYIDMLRRHLVFDYDTVNAAWFKHEGIITLGRFPFLFPQCTGSDRHIEYGFVGAKTPLRESVEAQLSKMHNVKFIMDGSLHKGADMNAFLVQCKRVLNISVYTGNREWHRVNQAHACGCDVLTMKPDGSFDLEVRDTFDMVTFLWLVRKLLNSFCDCASCVPSHN